MKRVSLIKGILLVLLSVVLMGTTGVYAADVDGDIDELMNFSGSSNSSNSSSNSSNSNSNSSNSNSNSSNTNSNSSNSNSNKNNSSNNTNTSNKNNSSNNTNSSVYSNSNNTSLPKTGIEDSLPIMVLVVVFGISTVYAYKKIRQYNNV